MVALALQLRVITPQYGGSTRLTLKINLEGIAFQLTFYTGLTSLPDYPTAGTEKAGLWYWDFKNSNGEPIVIGAGLSTGLDLFYPYRARFPTSLGKLFVHYNSSYELALDADLTAFSEGRATVYYQTLAQVEASGGIT